MITRRAYPDISIRVVYSLTKGLDLEKALEATRSWGEKLDASYPIEDQS